MDGLIPAGTPIMQVIPFKRDDWKSYANEYDSKEQIHKHQKIRKHLFGGYKKEHWQKKTFK